MDTLKDLFLNELADMYDAEKRIQKALPKLAKAATCTHLKDALMTHLKETADHLAGLEKVFMSYGLKARGSTCEATVGLLEEADEVAAGFKGSPALNAALICAVQKVEHYEIATYGCLYEWAQQLGNKDAIAVLKRILDQEHAANRALTNLARARSNTEALGNTELACADKGSTPTQATVLRRSVRPPPRAARVSTPPRTR